MAAAIEPKIMDFTGVFMAPTSSLTAKCHSWPPSESDDYNRVTCIEIEVMRKWVWWENWLLMVVRDDM